MNLFFITVYKYFHLKAQHFLQLNYIIIFGKYSTLNYRYVCIRYECVNLSLYANILIYVYEYLFIYLYTN